MSKVIVWETKSTKKELKLEYPIYLYFQDENCNSELVMVNENYSVTVKYEMFSLVIVKAKYYSLSEHYTVNNLTDREHFLDVYNEALQDIKDCV